MLSEFRSLFQTFHCELYDAYTDAEQSKQYNANKWKYAYLFLLLLNRVCFGFSLYLTHIHSYMRLHEQNIQAHPYIHTFTRPTLLITHFNVCDCCYYGVSANSLIKYRTARKQMPMDFDVSMCAPIDVNVLTIVETNMCIERERALFDIHQQFDYHNVNSC